MRKIFQTYTVKRTYLFLYFISFLFIVVQIHPQKILNLLPGKINRKFKHEVAPSITADGKTIFYIMQDPNKADVRARDDWNIYMSKLIDSKWTAGRPLRVLNTKSYEGYPSISADGNTLFFSSDAYTEDKDKDLYYSVFSNGKWSKPKNMGEAINIAGLDEIGGSISPNGQIFVFTAQDRDDSFGKEDIYISYKDKNGKWQQAKNLGRVINSKYREYAPYIAADGRTLYFSSDRKNGFGGMDLYKSVYKNKKWSRPVNLGKNVNTKGHDIGISIPAKGDIFFTSSSSLTGGYDILYGKLPAKSRPFKVILLIGKVIDKHTKQSITGNIIIEDLDTGKILGHYKSSDDGKFIVSLTEGTKYSITIEKNNYFILNENYNLKKTGKYREEKLLFKMTPIKKGEIAIVKNIFFNSGSKRLNRKSRLALNRIVTLMKKNPKLKIEIQGHTDNIGSKKRNLILSKQRAYSVLNYISRKGISRKRMKAKGLGDTKPKYKNDTKKNRALNRRIEFLILDY